MKQDQFNQIKDLHFPIHNKKYGAKGVHITCAECNRVYPCDVKILLDFIDESFGDAVKGYLK
jgi:hypothetical protein